MPVSLSPSFTGNTNFVLPGKLNYRPNEITHDHSSTISVFDFLGLPEKDHNEANSFLICNRSADGGNNSFTAAVEVLNGTGIVFTILLSSVDNLITGKAKLYYNIRFNDNSLQHVPPGLELKDDRGRDAREANEINFQGKKYKLIYGVFDEHMDNTDNIIFSISEKGESIYRIDPPIADTADPAVLNVYSYNTAFLMPLDLSDQDENEKVKVFYKAIPRNMDIIVLQEAFEPAKMNIVFRDLAPWYPYHSGTHNRILIPNIGKDGGIRIMSKYPILEEREISFSENGCTPEDFFSKFANKGVKYAKINKQGQMIHVFGTHTSEQPCDLYVMGKFIAGFDIPKEDIVVMAGDFNVDLNTFDPQTRVDVYSIMLDTINALEPTYRSFLNDWEYKGTTSGLNHYYCCNPDGKQHLDYVFVSSKHKIPTLFTNQSQMARLNEADESFGIFDMSDHEPIYARMEFPRLSTTVNQISACAGDSVTLTASVSYEREGSFQWLKGNSLLPGEVDNILRIPVIDSASFTSYKCIYSYSYMPDTAINNFFDSTYMQYHWVFRGATPSEISTEFIIVPSDSSATCTGTYTSIVSTRKINFKAYPNPATNELIILSDIDLIGYSQEVFDLTGRKISVPHPHHETKSLTIDVKNIVAGSYFLKLVKDGKQFVIPFIKM